MWWKHGVLLFYLGVLRSCRGSQLYFQLLQAEDTPSEKSLYHREGTRPYPSDRLPIDGIMESPDKYYDPRPGELNKKKLRKILGDRFDSDFMSVKHPKSKNGSLEFKFRNGRPVGKRPSFLRLIRTLKLRNGPTLKLKVGKKNRRKFQKFLWSYSYCPVKYVWRDLGRRFWPRWIKDGLCSRERSCSVPPGMFCKPSNSTTKTILRWHCPKWRRRVACKWIQIQYPIITECACSCHGNDDD
ncbi:noggin-2-like [Gigantopelta aegis]|uniref:noggin-2-like n=1 Tax=Gigantopelta aegis TaxID=1735272 RepID=UPI001B887797|nr:noggin-2-like [Gigantopelta aegis]